MLTTSIPLLGFMEAHGISPTGGAAQSSNPQQLSTQGGDKGNGGHGSSNNNSNNNNGHGPAKPTRPQSGE